jgi:hypothetical protein
LSYFPGACQLQWQVGILVVGDIPRNAKKLPLIPAVKLCLRGCVSIWRNTHSPGMGGLEYPSPYAATGRKKRLYWACL